MICYGASLDILNSVRWFLEEKRWFAVRVRTHFARMGSVVTSDAIDTTHGIHLIRTHDWNVSGWYLERCFDLVVRIARQGATSDSASGDQGCVLEKMATLHG